MMPNPQVLPNQVPNPEDEMRKRQMLVQALASRQAPMGEAPMGNAPMGNAPMGNPMMGNRPDWAGNPSLGYFVGQPPQAQSGSPFSSFTPRGISQISSGQIGSDQARAHIPQQWNQMNQMNRRPQRPSNGMFAMGANRGGFGRP